MIKIIALQVLIILSGLPGCSAKDNYMKIWYTCDFGLDTITDPDSLSDDCARIYINKALYPFVYELYKQEAELFYEFRNKLTALEHGPLVACEFIDNSDEVQRQPALIGYNLIKRIKLYESGQLQHCYLTAEDNLDFIQCLIKVRKKMIALLEKKDEFQSDHLF